MSTLQVRVEEYLGSIADTTALTDQLTAGAKLIADILPRDKLLLYSADLTDAGSGVTITGYRPLGAHKDNYEALPIPKGKKAAASDSSSIHYATARDPSWYVNTSKGYILPSGGKINAYAYPTAAFGDSTIAGFPTEYEHGVVLYTAVQQCADKLNTATDALNSLAYVAPTTTPTNPGAFSVSADVGTAIGLANDEFDKMAAEVASAKAELSEAVTNVDIPIDTANTAITTAAGRINTAVGLANAEFDKISAIIDLANVEFDKISAEIDSGDTVLTDGSDIEKGSSLLEVATKRIGNGDAYIKEARERFNNGMAYVQEAQTALNEVQGYSSEVSSRLAQVQAQLNIAQGYYDAAKSFFQTGQGYISEAQIRFSIDVSTYQQDLARYRTENEEYLAQVQNAQTKYSLDQNRLSAQVSHFQLLLKTLEEQFNKYIQAISLEGA